MANRARATKVWMVLAAGASAMMLAACGDLPAPPPEAAAAVSELKGAARDVASEAAKATGDLLDTRTACVMAGQSEAFCGCVAQELGPRLDAGHLDAMTGLVRAGLSGAPDQAADAAGTVLDEETRVALTRCATRAAVAGAVEGVTGN